MKNRPIQGMGSLAGLVPSFIKIVLVVSLFSATPLPSPLKGRSFAECGRIVFKSLEGPILFIMPYYLEKTFR